MYIRDNKYLEMRYYVRIWDEPISDLLRQASINTENQLMVLYDKIFRDFPDTGRSTGAYIVSYQSVPIDYCTHVPGLVA